MTVLIEIHHTGSSRGYQRGLFELKGRTVDYIALQFWKQVKKDLSYNVELEKIIVEGDKDITDSVLELEKQEQLKAYKATDDLPF